VGIVRATWRNFFAGGVHGGNTIPQQLARTLLLDREQGFRRKLQEAVIATSLEVRLGKEEMLTRYLDSVQFGVGATGISAAARLYFDKPVRDLDLAQSAMLAGLSGRRPSSIRCPAPARRATARGWWCRLWPMPDT
jgi:membrane peptidoglycan carboxypeptidase